MAGERGRGEADKKEGRLGEEVFLPLPFPPSHNPLKIREERAQNGSKEGWFCALYYTLSILFAFFRQKRMGAMRKGNGGHSVGRNRKS